METLVLKFSQRSVKELHLRGASKGIPDSVARRAPFVLDLLDKATSLTRDIGFFKSLRLTKIKGVRPPRFMVHIADGYWFTFRWDDNACIDIKIERHEE
jgi:plasmid maintenance system killer protein